MNARSMALLAGLVAVTPLAAHSQSRARAVSPAGAAVDSQVEARSASLRQAWLASGHAVPRAGTAPVIAAGSILTPTVNVAVAPAAVGVAMSYKAPNGLSNIMLDFSSATTTQGLGVFVTPVYDGRSHTLGTFTIEEPYVQTPYAFPFSPASTALSLYSAPGTWTLEGATVFDQSGQFTSYSGAQLASVFQQTSFQVVNTGSPDTVAPDATAGMILTPTVKLSSTNPLFAARMTVVDNLSGVVSGTLAFSQSGSFASGEASATVTAPVINGEIDFYDVLNSQFQPAGNYTLTSYSLCDAAGNCVTNNDVKPLFGTVGFRVVQ